MTQKERRAGTPSQERIFDYWLHNTSKLGPVKKGEDCGIERGECFACGNDMQPLERAHIIPVINGGNNSVENLHLLCRGCHAYSENIADYWTWLKYKRYNEWKYPKEHWENFLLSQGIDIEKEARKLFEENATHKEVERRIEHLATELFKKRHK